MNLEKIIENAADRCDLTSTQDQQRLYALAQTLLDGPGWDLKQVREAALRNDCPLEFRLAAKLYESRRFMQRNDRPCAVGVVLAMWGEQNRLRPRSDANPNGEDSLRRKIEQLAWITKDTLVTWTLYVVDDGCPNGSGSIAQQIAGDAGEHAHRIKVLFLEQAVGKGSGILGTIHSANESRKGGSVILGCQQAIDDGMDAVIYTDADCSVHLGQIGLLLQKHLEQGAPIVLGNRKAKGAVLVKQEDRWGVGIKVLRHMQRMIGAAIFSRGILDTQAAFKLYERDTLKRILDTACVVDFSFDTDWILAAIAQGERIETVPFAFIDSFAESASITQGPMSTWEILLKGLVKAVRVHGLAHNEEMARLIDEEVQSAADLDSLINDLPEELADVRADQLGDPAIMSPESLRHWIRQCKERAL